ncbi:flagellar motor protein MotS [Gracilibacillus halophilus YIM-C55.5]|uniref:Flagellar motor protein MotS n=1 Tax=Gracilibacillus halophilus YIM-C55.5 TaxID=1308866 RepID=N4W968_9BACI|nr:flagellar motor protein MotS [Gracilibacillus halophilus]ENH95784.1 flagellar motor protein MotS [Gracilibacillus halophilus YIM-C55.5]
MKLKKKRSEQKGAPKWMTTYSDMVTLILVFFVLLFSMSQIDAKKFQELAEALRNQSVMDQLPSIIPADEPSENSETQDESSGSDDPIMAPDESDNEDEQEPENSTPSEGDELDQLLADVETFLQENQLNNVISATRTDQGVVLVLQETLLFETGEAEILEEGRPFLEKVGTLLDHIPNQVRVEGHTDDRPISSFRYPSNWELSTARASSVIRYIIDESSIDSARFHAAGYGATEPVVPNDSPENWEKNRRVEIVILEEEND